MDRLAKLLQLHRGDPSPTLEFRPPIARLIDADHCMMLTEELREHGTPWTIKKATPTLWQQLPEAPGLYMFVWRPTFKVDLAAPNCDQGQTFAWVLYVGRTGADQSGNRLRSRYKGGYAKYLDGDPAGLWETDQPISREARLCRYLLLQPLEYWWTEIENAERIAILERRLVTMLSPPLNKQGAALRIAGRQNAFREE